MRVVAVAVEMLVIVMVMIVAMMRVLVLVRIGIGFLGQPFLDVGNLPLGIVEPAIEQALGGGFTFGRIENDCGRVQRMQPRENPGALCVVGKVGLG